MNTSDLIEAFEEILPDKSIFNDISRLLWQDADGVVELESEAVRVPENTRLEVVNKVFVRERFDRTGFGTYRAQVAVGGVQEEKFGILFARFCFATLYYNDECKLVTIDFHKEMR